MSNRSVVKFIRNELQIPGNTVHNGRGVWIMCSHVVQDWDDIRMRLERLIPSWERRGLSKTLVDLPDQIDIEFSSGHFGSIAYRRAMFRRTFAGKECLLVPGYEICWVSLVLGMLDH